MRVIRRGLLFGVLSGIWLNITTHSLTMALFGLVKASSSVTFPSSFVSAMSNRDTPLGDFHDCVPLIKFKHVKPESGAEFLSSHIYYSTHYRYTAINS